MATDTFHWGCKHSWRTSAKNTMWCVVGCSIGDFGTILFFQLSKIPFPVLGIMTLAIINGLLTSIMLETYILMKQKFDFISALKTACGMSFISMVSMEISMNATDYFLTGGAQLTWWVVPIMLMVGFLTPWQSSVSLNIKMVTTSEIILAIIIVSLSVVMPIYYYYQRKKNPKQDSKPSDGNEIKNYIDKINEITRKKNK